MLNFVYTRRTILVIVITLALSVAGLCTLATIVLSVVRFSKGPYNEEWIAPAVAWVNGINIFQLADANGPLLSVVYGPMFYLLYAPVVLLGHASQVLLAGTVWSMVLYSLPAAYYLITDRRGPPLARTVPILVFFTLTLASFWPMHVMLALHPDAAACGLAGLGVVLIAEARAALVWWRVATATLLCIAAIACKQNAVPGLIIVLTIVWWRAGWRQLGIAAAGSIGIGIAGVFVFGLLYGTTDGIWFNNYVIPMKLPLIWGKWSGGIEGAYQSMLAPLLLIASIAGSQISREAHRQWKPHILAFSASVIIVTTLMCIPVYLIWGAAGNAFAPAIYACILLPTAWTRHLFRNLRFDEELAQMTAFTPAVIVALIATSSFSLAVPGTPQLMATLGQSPSATIENYSKQHPGEVYFPGNPVAVYFSEGRFYHSDWGVDNREYAGFVATPAEFAKGTPQQAHFIAYPIPGVGPGYLLKKYYPNAQKAEISELSGFSVFAIK